MPARGIRPVHLFIVAAFLALIASGPTFSGGRGQLAATASSDAGCITQVDKEGAIQNVVNPNCHTDRSINQTSSGQGQTSPNVAQQGDCTNQNIDTWSKSTDPALQKKAQACKARTGTVTFVNEKGQTVQIPMGDTGQTNAAIQDGYKPVSYAPNGSSEQIPLSSVPPLQGLSTDQQQQAILQSAYDSSGSSAQNGSTLSADTRVSILEGLNSIAAEDTSGIPSSIQGITIGLNPDLSNIQGLQPIIPGTEVNFGPGTPGAFQALPSFSDANSPLASAGWTPLPSDPSFIGNDAFNNPTLALPYDAVSASVAGTAVGSPGAGVVTSSAEEGAYLAATNDTSPFVQTGNAAPANQAVTAAFENYSSALNDYQSALSDAVSWSNGQPLVTDASQLESSLSSGQGRPVFASQAQADAFNAAGTRLNAAAEALRSSVLDVQQQQAIAQLGPQYDSFGHNYGTGADAANTAAIADYELSRSIQSQLNVAADQQAYIDALAKSTNGYTAQQLTDCPECYQPTAEQMKALSDAQAKIAQDQAQGTLARAAYTCLSSTACGDPNTFAKAISTPATDMQTAAMQAQLQKVSLALQGAQDNLSSYWSGNQSFTDKLGDYLFGSHALGLYDTINARGQEIAALSEGIVSGSTAGLSPTTLASVDNIAGNATGLTGVANGISNGFQSLNQSLALSANDSAFTAAGKLLGSTIVLPAQGMYEVGVNGASALLGGSYQTPFAADIGLNSPADQTEAWAQQVFNASFAPGIATGAVSAAGSLARGADTLSGGVISDALLGSDLSRVGSITDFSSLPAAESGSLSTLADSLPTAQPLTAGIVTPTAEIPASFAPEVSRVAFGEPVVSDIAPSLVRADAPSLMGTLDTGISTGPMEVPASYGEPVIPLESVPSATEPQVFASAPAEVNVLGPSGPAEIANGVPVTEIPTIGPQTVSASGVSEITGLTDARAAVIQDYFGAQQQIVSSYRESIAAAQPVDGAYPTISASRESLDALQSAQADLGENGLVETTVADARGVPQPAVLIPETGEVFVPSAPEAAASAVDTLPKVASANDAVLAQVAQESPSLLRQARVAVSDYESAVARTADTAARAAKGETISDAEAQVNRTLLQRAEQNLDAVGLQPTGEGSQVVPKFAETPSAAPVTQGLSKEEQAAIQKQKNALIAQIQKTSDPVEAQRLLVSAGDLFPDDASIVGTARNKMNALSERSSTPSNADLYAATRATPSGPSVLPSLSQAVRALPQSIALAPQLLNPVFDAGTALARTAEVSQISAIAKSATTDVAPKIVRIGSAIELDIVDSGSGALPSLVDAKTFDALTGLSASAPEAALPMGLAGNAARSLLDPVASPVDISPIPVVATTPDTALSDISSARVGGATITTPDPALDEAVPRVMSGSPDVSTPWHFIEPAFGAEAPVGAQAGNRGVGIINDVAGAYAKLYGFQPELFAQAMTGVFYQEAGGVPNARNEYNNRYEGTYQLGPNEFSAWLRQAGTDVQNMVAHNEISPTLANEFYGAITQARSAGPNFDWRFNHVLNTWAALSQHAKFQAGIQNLVNGNPVLAAAFHQGIQLSPTKTMQAIQAGHDVALDSASMNAFGGSNGVSGVGSVFQAVQKMAFGIRSYNRSFTQGAAQLRELAGLSAPVGGGTVTLPSVASVSTPSQLIRTTVGQVTTIGRPEGAVAAAASVRNSAPVTTSAPSTAPAGGATGILDLARTQAADSQRLTGLLGSVLDPYARMGGSGLFDGGISKAQSLQALDEEPLASAINTTKAKLKDDTSRLTAGYAALQNTDEYRKLSPQARADMDSTLTQAVARLSALQSTANALISAGERAKQHMDPAIAIRAGNRFFAATQAVRNGQDKVVDALARGFGQSTTAVPEHTASVEVAPAAKISVQDLSGYVSSNYVSGHKLFYFIPAGFDVSKPSRTLVYFYGNNRNASDTFQHKVGEVASQLKGQNIAMVAFDVGSSPGAIGEVFNDAGNPQAAQGALNEAARALNQAVTGDASTGGVFAQNPLGVIGYSGGGVQARGFLKNQVVSARVNVDGGLVANLGGSYKPDEWTQIVSANPHASFVFETTPSDTPGEAQKILASVRASGRVVNTDHLNQGSVAFVTLEGHDTLPLGVGRILGAAPAASSVAIAKADTLSKPAYDTSAMRVQVAAPGKALPPFMAKASYSEGSDSWNIGAEEMSQLGQEGLKKVTMTWNEAGKTVTGNVGAWRQAANRFLATDQLASRIAALAAGDLAKAGAKIQGALSYAGHAAPIAGDAYSGYYALKDEGGTFYRVGIFADQGAANAAAALRAAQTDGKVPKDAILRKEGDAYIAQAASQPGATFSFENSDVNAANAATAQSPVRVRSGLNLPGLNPVIRDSMVQASRLLPPGYSVAFISAARGDGQSLVGNSSFHIRRDGSGHALAVDVRIYDANGQPLANIRAPQNFGIYRDFMQNVRAYQDQLYPNLKNVGRWGGYFSGVQPQDLMHYDLGPRNQTVAGNWEKGLLPGFASYGTSADVGKGMGPGFSVPKAQGTEQSRTITIIRHDSSGDTRVYAAEQSGSAPLADIVSYRMPSATGEAVSGGGSGGGGGGDKATGSGAGSGGADTVSGTSLDLATTLGPGGIPKGAIIGGAIAAVGVGAYGLSGDAQKDEATVQQKEGKNVIDPTTLAVVNEKLVPGSNLPDIPNGPGSGGYPDQGARYAANMLRNLMQPFMPHGGPSGSGGPGGGSGGSRPNPQPIPTPVPQQATLSCLPATVVSGHASSTVSIAWNCPPGTSAQGIGFVASSTTGSLPLAVSTSSSSVNFMLSCVRQNAQPLTASCTVAVEHPVVSLIAQPSLIPPQGIVHIAWVAADVRSCTLYDPDGQIISAGGISGAGDSHPLAHSSDFRVTCVGAAWGDTTATASVKVDPGVIPATPAASLYDQAHQ